MNRSIKAFVSLLLLVLFSAAVYAEPPKPVKDLKPTVILISLDGFRYDFLEKFQPPTLNQMARNGVRAKWMIPSFPTKTFPNHYAIATGLYPSNNGIVENNVFAFDTVFSMSKREEVENPRWWLGEPIWVTAEKQGQKAAAYFFPGTETLIKGKQPSFWRRYNGRVPNAMRVDKILSYLDLPKEQRPTVFTLYFSDVDDAGHEFGPDSEENKYAVWHVDTKIKRLLDGLKARKIDKQVNVIIVSDHGMAPYKATNATYLDDYFDFDLTERILWTGEIIQIFPKPGKTDEIHSKIKNLPHVTCWKKDEIPAQLNYSGSDRIAPIVCSSEMGWVTTSRKRQGDWIGTLDDPERLRGAHGYDNKYQEMQSIFIAQGAAFKQRTVVEPFENVDVYNVMCRILGITPAKNDGKLKTVDAVLR